MLEHVWRRSQEAGISVKQDEFVFLCRAMTEYLAMAPQAKQVMLKLLSSTVVEGSYTKQYYPEGYFGSEEKRLDYRKLVEYRGYIYGGKAVPWSAIEVQASPDLEACEGCGGSFPKTYCAQVVRVVSGTKEHLKTLCNRCRLHSDDTRVRDSASQKTCGSCKIETCQFHPRRHLVHKARLDEPPHPATQKNSGPGEWNGANAAFGRI